MNPTNSQMISFSSIERSVPEAPGIYAWYARVHISSEDIKIIKIHLVRTDIKHQDKKLWLNSELKRLIFDYFKEEDYYIKVSGQLKPQYEGKVSHDNDPPDALLEKIIKDPNRLDILAKSLETISPYFASPLYIGMAQNLKSRLLLHKEKIRKLQELHQYNERIDAEGDTFASRIVSRGYKTHNLFIYYTELNYKNDRFVDIETTLNRINYPVFGRN